MPYPKPAISMLYIPKIYDYLKILTEAEVNEFVAINFSGYFKSTREKSYSKVKKKQNVRKVELLYIFLKRLDEVERYVDIMKSNSSDNCVHRYNIESLNLFDPELQLIITKPMIKNKLNC